jgi:hypothetical protein
MAHDPPSRHLGFHQLLDAMRLADCPICRLAGWACHRSLDALFYGYVNDPHVREELRQAEGFCAKHVQQVLQAGSPVGGSIIYADVLRHVAGHLQRQPSGVCPGCASEATAASNAIADLVEHIGEEDVHAAYRAGDGLCLPHLRQALSQSGGRVRALLEEVEGEKLYGLAHECEALVAKSDYQHIGEELGRERDAWKRAARKLAGARTDPRGDR